MQHRSVTPLKYLEHLKWFNFLRSLFSQEVMSYHDRALHLKYSEKNSVHGVKVSKYGVFSGPYFPVFGLNTGKVKVVKISLLKELRKEFYAWSFKLYENCRVKFFEFFGIRFLFLIWTQLFCEV